MAHLVPLDFWIDAKNHCEILKPLFWLAECDVIEYHEVFDVNIRMEMDACIRKIGERLCITVSI